MRSYCTFILLTLLLSGCGHKGPLYLPEVNQPNNAQQNGTEDK